MSKEKIKNYIISIINNEDDITFHKKSTVEKAYFLHRRFLDEYFHPYNQNKYKGNQRRAMASWIAGLPSCFNVDYFTDCILDLAKEWGYILDTEEKEEDFVENFFQLIADNFMNMIEEK